MATESDNVNTALLGTIAAVTALVTVSVVLGVTALVRSEQSAAVLAKGTTANLRPQRDLRAKQLAVLRATPSWKDRQAGIVTLPLDRAMGRVVEDLVQDPSSATPPAPEPEPSFQKQQEYYKPEQQQT